MPRFLLLFIFPFSLYAQEHAFESEVFETESANTNLCFSLEAADFFVVETAQKENRAIIRITLRGLSEEEFQQFLEEERYHLTFEKGHLSMPNWEPQAALEEQIRVEIEYPALYEWNEGQKCLVWKDADLIARSDIPFSFQYVISLRREAPPTMIFKD